MRNILQFLLALMLFAAVSLTTFAYDFSIGAIYYNITDASKKTVEVTCNDKNYDSYSGTIIIPSTVTYSGINYSVTSIGEGAFYHCSNLTSVTIPNSVTTIKDEAFFSNWGLKSIDIPTSVASIGVSAFSLTGLTSVDIPNSVTSIGDNAFYGCTGLTSISIPNSVTSIGKNVFSLCSGLTSVDIPNSVTSIGIKAFSDCTGLTSISIPNSVTIIDKYAFYGCTGLTSVSIPNSVTSIGRNAFGYCSNLQKIDVSPDNEYYASQDGVLFSKDMRSLVQFPGGKSGAYYIPNSVTSIGSDAFSGTIGLTSVTIPSSVTSIAEYAFYNCTGLKNIYCNAPNPPIIYDEKVFNGCYAATLHVPAGCMNKYKSASFWSNFMTIVDDGLPSGIYLGVIGFNNDLYERSIGILTASNVNECTNFVNSFSLGMNTLLYYSADHALKQIVKPTYPTDLTNAIIITFTDGLDRGSLAMQSTFSKNADYADYIGKTIGSTKVNGQALQAYSLGVLGDDVSDTETFTNNLKSLASNPENATLIDDIDNLNQKFNEIYDELERRSVSRALKISTAIMEDGEVCRFTLDGVKDAKDVEKSSLWVEGTYDFASKALKNVKYYGFTSTSGTTIIGIQDPSLRQNLIFTFEDCRDVKGDPIDIKDLNNVNQWRYIKTSGVWERNSEMMSGENIEIEVKRTSAVVMLLLDCSLSLGEEDLAKLKFQANAFIERLAGVKGQYNGVEDIRIASPDSDAEIDWSNAEYYNLQGVRVDNPSSGLYIQRVGRHTRKIMLR